MYPVTSLAISLLYHLIIILDGFTEPPSLSPRLQKTSADPSCKQLTLSRPMPSNHGCKQWSSMNEEGMHQPRSVSGAVTEITMWLSTCSSENLWMDKILPEVQICKSWANNFEQTFADRHATSVIIFVSDDLSILFALLVIENSSINLIRMQPQYNISVVRQY